MAGLYILTRSPRSHISWLAALPVWALSTFFLHIALAINLPASGVLSWLRFLVILILLLWLHQSIDLVSVGAASLVANAFIPVPVLPPDVT